MGSIQQSPAIGSYLFLPIDFQTYSIGGKMQGESQLWKASLVLCYTDFF